jgi:hypothetical protein
MRFYLAIATVTQQGLRIKYRLLPGSGRMLVLSPMRCFCRRIGGHGWQPSKRLPTVKTLIINELTKNDVVDARQKWAEDRPLF